MNEKYMKLALKEANGEYITFLDSDDFFAPGILEEINQKIDSLNSDIIISNLQMTYKNINASFLGSDTSKIKGQTITPQEYKKHIYEERPSVTGKFFKRELIDSIFPPGLKWEDFAFVIPYYTKAKSIHKTSLKYNICVTQSYILHEWAKSEGF